MVKPKGSTVCITVMFAGWIAYVIGQGWFYVHFKTWLPVELTWGTAALFLGECVSLARLKLAKERQPVVTKKVNPMLTKVGITDLPDFEDEVQQAAADASETPEKKEVE